MSEPRAQGPALSALGLHKSFTEGGQRIGVLRNLSLQVQPGERVVVFGRSGAGKSTLLHILAGLDDADAGEVRVCGAPFNTLNAAQRARLRNGHMGFVYQLHHLLPEFTALENVLMPLRLRGQSKGEALPEAQAMLEAVGLADRAGHRPAKLSGGERQRAAVARALVGKPAIVLADEPTGNLDKDSARQVFDLMCALSDAFAVALVLVTHDESAAPAMHRALHLDGGLLRPWRKQ